MVRVGPCEEPAVATGAARAWKDWTGPSVVPVRWRRPGRSRLVRARGRAGRPARRGPGFFEDRGQFGGGGCPFDDGDRRFEFAPRFMRRIFELIAGFLIVRVDLRLQLRFARVEFDHGLAGHDRLFGGQRREFHDRPFGRAGRVGRADLEVVGRCGCEDFPCRDAGEPFAEFGPQRAFAGDDRGTGERRVGGVLEGVRGFLLLGFSTARASPGTA